MQGASIGVVIIGLLLSGLACSKEPASSPGPEPEGVAAQSAAVSAEKGADEGTRGVDKPASGQAPSALDVSGSAKLGQPAPDFTLSDLEGKPVRLADYRGKTVVLEWFNPECPFVQKSHTKGSLVGAAAAHGNDSVVWLAINSGAPGKQGHGLDVNRSGAQGFGMKHPVLLDESGRVGKAYGAERTPHMFIIDPQGVLVYHGAIDNSPDGEGASPNGGTLVKYVERALAELAAGKPVSISETEAYGCSVKYGG